MKLKDYRQLTDELTRISDVPRLAKKYGLHNELLHVIYSQKISRDTTRRFYKVKRKTGKMLYQWKKGRSFLQIAEDHDFPPTMIAMFILQENKIPRKKVWGLLQNPDQIKDKRMRKDIIEANKADGVYSPNGMKRQVQRGKWGENKMQKWLNIHNFQFETEEDIRGKHKKTPDFLLKKPLKWEGQDKIWIESKATFGDAYEVKRHVKKQLQPYKEIFGDGLVVYWYGYLDELSVNMPEGVSMTDGSSFEKDLNKTPRTGQI
jgi:hypothetical protein